METQPATPMPLQLSGFLDGNTIQVDGDTGNLQFSVKFNIHQTPRKPNKDTEFHFPSLNSMENDMFCQSSCSSPYQTPQSTQQTENENGVLDLDTLTLENHGDGVEEIEKPETTNRGTILTRLKSGAISQVKYCFSRISREKCRDSRSCRTTKRKRKRGDNLFDKLLQRRCCPVKPCNSYVFFVMARWGSAQSSSSSFGETSKRLGRMWCKLPRKHKKIYEDIAVKDSARYKRQCMLLNCKEQRTFPPTRIAVSTSCTRRSTGGGKMHKSKEGATPWSSRESNDRS